MITDVRKWPSSCRSCPTLFVFISSAHLSCQSFTVSELVELTGAKTSNVSQQLKIMLLAGYLVKQRRGKKIYYELREKRITFLLDQLENLYPVES